MTPCSSSERKAELDRRWTDRNTCVLFGDGAGAAVLQRRGRAAWCDQHTHIGSDGDFTDILFMPGGGSRCKITAEKRT